jgi:oligopeptide/dipeptide ABC transporter ATP-binding protein
MYAGRILEEGGVETIFHNPLHPYTQGLLEANPIFHEPKNEIPTIRGELGEMTSRGCNFYPRCQRGNKACSKENIPLMRVSVDHFVRCKELAVHGRDEKESD